MRCRYEVQVSRSADLKSSPLYIGNLDVCVVPMLLFALQLEPKGMVLTMLNLGPSNAAGEQKKSIRFRLRDTIDDVHHDAEAIVERIDIFNDPDAYAHWLLSMYRVHHRFSVCTDATAMQVGLEANSPALLQALRSDLAAVGHAAPSRTPPLRPSSAEQLFGTSYVLEGSGLGARVLLKRAEAHNVQHRRYIDTLKRTSQRRWPVFISALEREPLSFQSTAHASLAVFAFLTTHLKSFSP